MIELEFYMPVKIKFGYDKLRVFLEEVKDTIGDTPYIVTTEFFKTNSIKKEVYNLFPNSQEFYVSPNPKSSEIDVMLKELKNRKFTSILGIGGGSALDAAKALSVLFDNFNSISEYFIDERSIENRKINLVAIPTTAGTGSELSKGAIITDEIKGTKRGVRGNGLFPDFALIDPKLTETLPENVIIETGFDVLTHALESYISKKASIITEKYSIEAFRIIFEELPLLIKERNNKERIEKISYASMLMGINLSNSSTCLPHRLQYPFGAETDTSHGIGLAIIYPGWLEYTYEKVTKFKEFEEKVGISNLKEELLNWIKNLNLNKKMSDYQIKLSSEELSKKVEGNLSLDPGYNDEVVRKIYEYVY